MFRALARSLLLTVLVAACGSSPPPAAPPPAAAAGPSEQELVARREQQQRAAELATHRKLETEQQEALAETCDEPPPHDQHARCLPSCYPTEPADPRAGQKPRGPVAIEHLVCEPVGSDDPAARMIADELAGATLHVRPVRGRFPAPHRKGSWQADVEAWLAGASPAKPPRGDVFVVTGTWRERTHPLTGERLRCVTVAHYTRALRGGLDACGASGDVGCEAAGDAAARGLNVVHYRLAEARRLQAAGKPADCQQAALEAIAVARGMPRWRQYAKLNVEKWAAHAAYRTRFDGTLDEDTLFATAARLGSEAEALYAACGGPAGAPTTPEQEQSFHTCW